IVRTNFSEQLTSLYRNYGGAFEEVALRAGLGVNRKYLGFGVDFFDFDNDGDVDVLVNNLDGPPTLLRNDGGGGHGSILVKCIGTKSNRSAIGTRVRVTLGAH